MGNGGQIVFAIAEAAFDVSLPFFCRMHSLSISPSRKKKLGFEILLYLPEKGCYFLGGSCCARIEVEVLMYKLRCPCRD